MTNYEKQVRLWEAAERQRKELAMRAQWKRDANGLGINTSVLSTPTPKAKP